MSDTVTYTLAEIRNGTGFPPDVRFQVIEPAPAPLESDGKPDEDGDVPCPDPDCLGIVAERDTAERWNDLQVREDGTVVANIGNNGDYEGAGFLCTTCLADVEMPADFEVHTWV